MTSPYASPAASDLPTRNLWWVLRAAVAAVALGAWLVLMLHVFLVARAEYRLRQVLEQSQAFAQLPQMTPAEILGYTRRQFHEQSLAGGQVRLAYDPQARALAVRDLRARPDDGLSRTLRPLTGWLVGSTEVSTTQKSSPLGFPPR